jgi:hypothetical protein
MVPAFAGPVLGLPVVVGLAALGLGLGVRGWRMASNVRPQSPLVIVGVATGVAAMILRLMVRIDLVVILASFAG